MPKDGPEGRWNQRQSYSGRWFQPLWKMMEFVTLHYPYVPCMEYMVTFTINIPPMLAYIPYMDPMGYEIPNWMESHKKCSKAPTSTGHDILHGKCFQGVRSISYLSEQRARQSAACCFGVFRHTQIISSWLIISQSPNHIIMNSHSTTR